jgi:hypothetical protein
VSFVLDSLPRLVEGSSYGAWKASSHAPEGGAFVEAAWNECGADITETALGANRTMRRVAAFYVPPAPSPLQLPDRPPSEVLGRCRFGVAWGDVSELTEQRASDLETAHAKSVTAMFGPGSSSGALRIAPPWPAVVGWQYTTFWNRDTVTVVSGVTYRPRWRDRTDTPVAFLAAAGTVSGDGTPPWQIHDRESAVYPTSRARVEEAIVLTQVKGSPADAIRAVLTRVAAADHPRGFPDDEKLRVYADVARWVRATADLPAGPRAAALVVADHLVSMVGEIPGREHESVRALEASGARLNWVEFGNDWALTHEWLKQAWQLDRGGRAGEMAFQALMEMGFETSGECRDQRGEGFRAVLARGEAFLRELPDSRIRGDVHLMMARAAGTIVTLGTSGWGGSSPDLYQARYRRESAAARARALEHYRAFFDAEPQRTRAERVWPEAFRLAAGLTTPMHFFCIQE